MTMRDGCDKALPAPLSITQACHASMKTYRSGFRLVCSNRSPHLAILSLTKGERSERAHIRAEEKLDSF